MASRRVLPHTVHLFNYIGEVNDEAQFQESVIRFCYCSWNEGSGSAKAPSDSAKLYVFDANSIIEDAAGNRRTLSHPKRGECALTNQIISHFPTMEMTIFGLTMVRSSPFGNALTRSLAHAECGIMKLRVSNGH